MGSQPAKTVGSLSAPEWASGDLRVAVIKLRQMEQVWGFFQFDGWKCPGAPLRIVIEAPDEFFHFEPSFYKVFFLIEGLGS